jgi:hypothetical protein
LNRIDKTNGKFKFRTPNELGLLIVRGVGGMLAQRPDLRMEITLHRLESGTSLRQEYQKENKKNEFNDEVLISNVDAQKLKKYIKDNFIVN